MIRQKEVERREENSDVLGRLKEPGCTLPVGQSVEMGQRSCPVSRAGGQLAHGRKNRTPSDSPETPLVSRLEEERPQGSGRVQGKEVVRWHKARLAGLSAIWHQWKT